MFMTLYLLPEDGLLVEKIAKCRKTTGQRSNEKSYMKFIQLFIIGSSRYSMY